MKNRWFSIEVRVNWLDSDFKLWQIWIVLQMLQMFQLFHSCWSLPPREWGKNLIDECIDKKMGRIMMFIDKVEGAASRLPRYWCWLATLHLPSASNRERDRYTPKRNTPMNNRRSFECRHNGEDRFYNFIVRLSELDANFGRHIIGFHIRFEIFFKLVFCLTPVGGDSNNYETAETSVEQFKFVIVWNLRQVNSLELQ